jgi:hypothetical protein
LGPTPQSTGTERVATLFNSLYVAAAFLLDADFSRRTPLQSKVFKEWTGRRGCFMNSLPPPSPTGRRLSRSPGRVPRIANSTAKCGFGAQEAGTAAAIGAFRKRIYRAARPLFAQTGAGAHPALPALSFSEKIKSGIFGVQRLEQARGLVRAPDARPPKKWSFQPAGASRRYAGGLFCPRAHNLIRVFDYHQ